MTYKDKSYLYEQHWIEGKSLREIGREHGVSHKTISYWFKKYDLPKRGVGGEFPHIPFRTAPENSESAGYELWRVSSGDDRGSRVKVHRLAAVAEYGIEAVKGMEVHHKNGLKWDNRPENLQLLTSSEHKELHHEEGLYDGNEFWKESPNYLKTR